ncbi:MAG: hypothetical protein PVSMB8_00160 [Vulcanimicrobiaceae bacterium]
MRRGDNLVFTIFVVRHVLTGELSTYDPGDPIPQGFRSENLTGWKIWFTAKHNVVDPDLRAVAALDTVAGGVTIVNAVGGQVSINMPATATRAEPDGMVALVYDIQGKDGAATIATLEDGTLVVSPDVTRAIV